MTGSDVWLGVYGGIVDGARHELNNRVASLSAVEQVVSAGGTLTESLREALVSELRRMRGAIHTVGRIPGSSPRPIEAVRLQDLIATVVELIALHPDGRDSAVEVTCSDEIVPVRVDPDALGRSILVAMAAAMRARAGGGVAVGCEAEGPRVLITVRPASGSDGDLPETTEAERLAIAAWLRPSDGAVDPTVAGAAFSISLPALQAPGAG